MNIRWAVLMYLRRVSVRPAAMKDFVSTKKGKGDDLMESMVELIVNGATEFTPDVLVRLIVFSLTLECIGTIAFAITGVGRR